MSDQLTIDETPDWWDFCVHGLAASVPCTQCEKDKAEREKNSGRSQGDLFHNELMTATQQLPETTPEAVVAGITIPTSIIPEPSTTWLDQTVEVYQGHAPLQVPFNPALVAPEVKVFLPSPQQQAFFDWVTTGFGSAVIIAVAGSGKTTTLLESLSRMSGSILMLAFNAKIAAEIKSKLAARGLTQVWSSTFHAHGRRLWMQVAPNCKKEGLKREKGEAGYFKIQRIFDEVKVNGYTCPKIYRPFVKAAVQFAKQRLFGVEVDMGNKEAWMEMVAHYNLDETIADEVAKSKDTREQETSMEEHVLQALRWTVRSLRYGIEIAREVIDFEDMIYMPLQAKVQPRFTNDWVLVDELQDTNPARRAYVRMVMKSTGRSIWVGDPCQSIYGFTGADHLAIERVRFHYDCIELPLTVSYRCPKAVVRTAQTWVKHIESHPDAPEGISEVVDEAAFSKMTFLPTDAILCRNNAPLVSLALQFIRKGIACHVEGSDIGGGLIKLVERFKDIVNLDHLTKVLEDYRETEVEKLANKNMMAKAAYVADMVDSLLSVIASMGFGATLDQLKKKIKDMFLDADDQPKQVLTLSSIHKSKGREWERVFWYGPNVFQPSKYAVQGWELIQERNLFYVACTRAKAELYRVNVVKKLLQEPQYAN